MSVYTREAGVGFCIRAVLSRGGCFGGFFERRRGFGSSFGEALFLAIEGFCLSRREWTEAASNPPAHILEARLSVHHLRQERVGLRRGSVESAADRARLPSRNRSGHEAPGARKCAAVGREREEDGGRFILLSSACQLARCLESCSHRALACGRQVVPTSIERVASEDLFRAEDHF